MQPEAIDMQAIQEAMERRKNGSMQPASPQGMPMGGQPAPSQPMPEQAPAMPAGAPPETKESSVIVKALIDRLKQYSVK